MSLNSLSVILITKNEEANIVECLTGLRWANEIVVVDAGSSDKTVEKARTFTDKVFIRPWEGYGAAKNFALSQATSSWILWIDADERLTDSLKEEILLVAKGNSEQWDAYSFPRKANFLGRWIHHCGWYPGRVTRLFRKGKGHFTLARVHEQLEVEGPIGELQSDLLHYTDPSIFHYIEKFNKYTTLGADELADQRRSFRLDQITVRPLWTFVRMYFLKLGFLDGIPGFILCVLSSCYVFTKYAKLWEQRKPESMTETNR